jgi:DNA-binding MurR/RpiR family transcriptional regulator
VHHIHLCSREAIKRREQGETLADIARTYNVSPATISRL